jgi:hypothetical protein
MKKRVAKVVFLIICGFLLLLPLCAQDSGAANGNAQNEEQTVEELFLQSIEMRIVGEQAFAEERAMKLTALDNLEAMIDDGKVGENDEEAHYILERLSREGIGVQLVEGRRVVNNYPEVRRRSAELLGRMGGTLARDSLINVLISDPEPMVMAEAAYALGGIGDNENQQVTQALAFSILNQNIMTPDNNFAFAAILAFEKLMDSEAGLQDRNAFRALIRISQGNYIHTVRKKADEVLQKMAGY